MLGLQDPNLQKRIFHFCLFDIGRRGPWLACAWLLLGPSFWLLPKLLHPAVVKISILCRVILMDPPMAPRRSVFTLVQSSLQCSSVEASVPECASKCAAQSRTIPIACASVPKLPGHFAFACPTFQCQLQKRKKKTEIKRQSLGYFI